MDVQCISGVALWLSYLLIDWHYNEAHYGKGLMDGKGNVNKNVNSEEDFCEAGN